MSHIVTIKTEIRDAVAVGAACRRLRLGEPVTGKHRLFTSEAEGLGVQLPGWRYPVVCELPTGQLKFDNFNGHWGDPRELDKLLQGYAVEKAKLEARRQGHSVSEQTLDDGSVRVRIVTA